MPGTLFVLGRDAPAAPWELIAGPLLPADVAAVVNLYFIGRRTARVVVANGFRSFTARAIVDEDPAVIVEP
jgi:hypothetical protein